MQDTGRSRRDRARRGVRLALALVLPGGALPGAAAAQCVSLGPPGLVGCALPGSPAPVLTCAGNTPSVGSSAFTVVASGFPAGSSVVELFLGFCAAPPIPPPAFVLPCPAAPSGCTLRVDLGAFFVIPPRICSGPSCIPVWPLPIPNQPALAGATVCAQSIAIALAAPSPCSVISNGLAITIVP